MQQALCCVCGRTFLCDIDGVPKLSFPLAQGNREQRRRGTLRRPLCRYCAMKRAVAIPAGVYADA